MNTQQCCSIMNATWNEHATMLSSKCASNAQEKPVNVYDDNDGLTYLQQNYVAGGHVALCALCYWRSAYPCTPPHGTSDPASRRAHHKRKVM
jgi:hypothetical protein